VDQAAVNPAVDNQVAQAEVPAARPEIVPVEVPAAAVQAVVLVAAQAVVPKAACKQSFGASSFQMIFQLLRIID
jgi:hypothetical protein